MKSLLVVESPAKAKTINKYLGKDYKVLASFGHITEIPSKDGEVDVNNNFDIHYEISKSSTKHVKDLVDAMKGCDKLILATDPDREGEAIAWHVLEVLKKKKAIKKDTKVERVVFNAITKQTVEKAIKEPRDIDYNLVKAQQARQALDYLVGFNLSPVLWRKLPGSKSAGRVQSVALRLIAEKFNEILKFKPEEYWTIDVILNNTSKKKLNTKLISIDGKKLDKMDIKNEKQATEIKNELEKETYIVKNIEEKEVKRNPYQPFTTSTLQQEASKKLGFSTKKTMQIAQKLYEGIDVGNGLEGLITYMRTDGVYTAPEAIEETRKLIKNTYGDKYLPKNAIIYETKVKNAQEAHEAIRPTHPNYKPQDIERYLTGDEYKLYDLIWKRLIASQMEKVILAQTSIDIATSKHILRATGSVIKFDGFYILYNETNEDSKDEGDTILPKVEIGEKLSLQKIDSLQHFTEPPAKYSEASLVKKMEELGIGRPSTYASIISVIQDRGYVRLEKKRFIPENRGLVASNFLKLFFPKYVEYDYTAKLEEDLDIISNGKKDYKEFLSEFWIPFKKQVDETMLVKNADVLDKLSQVMKDYVFGYDENGKLKNTCPKCGAPLNLKSSKYGLFIGCTKYPECDYTEKLTMGGEDEEINQDNENEDKKTVKFENKTLGQKDGINVYLKKGPYGFYVQLGEDSEKPKPKRVAIAKGTNIDEFTLEQANSLLALPRTIGNHPEDGGKIIANIGPYGPYLNWNKKFYSVKNDNILTITLDRAVEVINEEIEKKKNNVKKTSTKATSKKTK